MISNTLSVQRTLLLAIVLIVFCSPLLRADETVWIHVVSNTDPRAGQFRIRIVGEEDDHLIGSATYREVGHDVTVKIEGVETLDGRFWPGAVFEGATDWNGPWKRVNSPKVPGRTISLPFRFAAANPILYFNLDSFRPIIGEMKYGRIVLPNGYNTAFELSEILGSKAASGSTKDDWDLNIIQGYLSNPIAQGPFFVDRIAFRDGRLRAEAGYVEPKGISATTIEGTKTQKQNSSEEEFWASATLQVANDPDGKWKTIGQAATPGKSANIILEPNEESIRNINIDVDTLQPMIGRFGYGRAVLKNGKAAAFELFNMLQPKDKE